MPTYRVFIPERFSPCRRKMTEQQFLAEHCIYDRSDGITRVFDLPHPVRIEITAPDDRTCKVKTCRTSTELFGLFGEPGLITSLSWQNVRLGTSGLYALNYALHTGAVRKDGLNIVRHWLENRTGHSQPLGCDFAALLSFLEIRSIARHRKRSIAVPKKPLAVGRV